MMKKLIIPVIVLMAQLFLMQISWAQEDCLTPIRQYVEKMANVSEPQPGQIYFMQFTVQTIPAKDSSLEPSKVESKIYKGKDKLIMESGDVAIYQDEKDAFMVIHPLKRIVWTKKEEKTEKSKPFEMGDLQKLILSESKMIYCKKIEPNEGDVIQVKLKMNEKISDDIKVDFLIIDFDNSAGRIIKVQSVFGPGQQLDRQIVAFQNIDFNYSGKKIPAARTMIFKSNGELLAGLANYSLIDNQ